MKTKFGLNMKQLKASIGAGLFAMGTASQSAFADLNTVAGDLNSFIGTIGTTLNVLAGLAGAYLVFNGIMTWKKSSSDHGQQVEFKSIAIPIIAGSCLVAFSSFVGFTSTTFGLTSTYAPGGAVSGGSGGL
jgi:hypothetical protein